MYAIVKDDKLIKAGTLQELFPNVTYPETGPGIDFLNKNNVVPVETNIEHDSQTEHLVPCDVYKNTKKWYAVKVVKMTDEEAKAHLDAHLDFEIISTDLQKTEFKKHRAAVEKLRSANSLNEVTIPTKPEVKDAE
jgi:hypothetical protein